MFWQEKKSLKLCVNKTISSVSIVSCFACHDGRFLRYRGKSHSLETLRGGKTLVREKERVLSPAGRRVTGRCVMMRLSGGQFFTINRLTEVLRGTSVPAARPSLCFIPEPPYNPSTCRGITKAVVGYYGFVH